MTEPYQNREIDQKHQALMGAIADVKTITMETREQAIKTNGRVGKLEQWRSYITGGLAVLVVMMLPILIWLDFSNISVKKSL